MVNDIIAIALEFAVAVTIKVHPVWVAIGGIAILMFVLGAKAVKAKR